MKTTVIAASILSILAVSPAQADSGYVSQSAAKFGDFLSSWGRSDSSKQASGVLPLPTLTASGLAGNDCNAQHKALADASVKAQNKRIDEMKPSPKGFGEMSCFDKYKNFSLTSAIGVPSIDAALAQMKGQACAYVDQQVSAATDPLNQSIWLPGGAGRVNTSVLAGGTTSGATTTTTSSGFSLPNIFN